MLQFSELSEQAHQTLAKSNIFPPEWETLDDLEQVTERWMAQWFAERNRLGTEGGFWTRNVEAVDQRIRTEKIEFLDDPNCPVKTKMRIVRGVHFFNALYRTYTLYAKTLTPLIEEIAAAFGRPARLLELASGSGEQAMALATTAQKRGLPVTITGSDYIQEYVDDANARAQARKAPVRFEVINALELGALELGAHEEQRYDIVLICGATHHFSLGQLARMVAASARIATSAFVSIDGRRGFANLFGIVQPPLFTFQFALLHDAWISARKFYTRYELEHTAQIAAPDADISTVDIGPSDILSCMTVRFN